jgi:hypothetical protein
MAELAILPNPPRPARTPAGAKPLLRERMIDCTRLPVRRGLVLLIAGVLGCGSDLLLPTPPGGGEDVALSKVAGDAQIGTVGEQLPKPLVVQVLTQRDEPAVNRQVEFSLAPDAAAGEVSPEVAVTDEHGNASASWKLGTALGSHTVVARVVGSESETQQTEFRAEAKAAAPDTISAASPLSQPGRRRKEVGTPPAVRVVDRFGNPVEGVSVAWQVIAGQGEVKDPITETGADGSTSAKWTLGSRIGVQKLTASIGQGTGSPVTFTATVLF